jgi:hypothetical protein
MKVGMVAALLLVAHAGWAEHELREIEWPSLLPDGARLSPDGSVSVTSTRSEGLTLTLVEVESPGITKERYAVRGRVRYRDVSGRGYVEMWSVFSEGRYFTRTEADQGPMRALTGSSDWRPIVLPFDSKGAKAPPERLILNVVLPGTGEVTLSPLTLVELEPGEWPGAGGAGAGLWGGVAGALLGIVAAFLGWLGNQGRARTLVLSGFRLIMAAGGLALAAGLITVLRGLSYDVYYPLLLIGGIALLVPATTLPRLEKRYQELELRRMSAADA